MICTYTHTGSWAKLFLVSPILGSRTGPVAKSEFRAALAPVQLGDHRGPSCSVSPYTSQLRENCRADIWASGTDPSWLSLEYIQSSAHDDSQARSDDNHFRGQILLIGYPGSKTHKQKSIRIPGKRHPYPSKQDTSGRLYVGPALTTRAFERSRKVR